jgi:predicted PurR-regulated permease PerM
LVVILCAFAWAKEFLLPIVLAGVMSFVLAPVISRLERWGIHPVLAVLSVVAVNFMIIGALCATLSVQTLDLVSSLPKYRDNIHTKWVAIQQARPGPLNLAVRNIGDMIDDLSKATAPAGPSPQSQPLKVQIVSGAESALALVKNSMTPALAPLAELAVVVVLVVFMLLERKRIRNRFLRLIGHSHLVTTTLAVDEAGSRLSRGLLMQLQVNSAFALAVGIGLSLIGIPNAALWAVLTLVLRFLPYVGLWISAFFPLVLSIAISTSWTAPILTLGLYIFLEVFTNNVIEPFAIGGSTGMSPLAVIVSALFWAWLWGPIGLLLATPLTACLVVLGRYFQGFRTFTVLLAEDPPTSPEAKLIQFLTENRVVEARALIHELGEKQLSVDLAEGLIVPAVRAIENDLFPGGKASHRKSRIYKQMRQLIEELTFSKSADSVHQPEAEKPGVFIVPFLREGAEIVGIILARLLDAEGIEAKVLSWRTLRTEKVERLKELNPRWILLSAIESRSAISVGEMARSIQLLLPDAVISIGLWSLPSEGAAQSIGKIKETSGSVVYTRLDEAFQSIVLTTSQADRELRPENINASGSPVKDAGQVIQL